MNIKTNCTDRKAMAHALAAHLGTTAEYLRTPTYAFRVGSLQVERDGSITGERADLEAAAAWLQENGYIQEPIPAGGSVRSGTARCGRACRGRTRRGTAGRGTRNCR